MAQVVRLGHNAHPANLFLQVARCLHLLLHALHQATNCAAHHAAKQPAGEAATKSICTSM